ncbi:hypothetical protein PPL_08975 [Heterostelium album PN500]|uniref:NELF-A N-terminal domain-containing protein n=1 Tax=Heterostelium pallidum (strain ATCC 26659 / Pp 5 / PN500) TaxID=670386 RepID=D3BK94_HETP5|nr:hypothetical protein PPL_08975 [Heterostelium album PN500]EFA78324.1 hypothetical protein PPL_08975 [Heterostelium album PN500]|eukprot:XP_020430449.1 hypothetical protein PPL_08975 [Heterostelium album PN500]
MEHRDVEGWLTSKLEETWSSEKLAPILTKDILQFCLLKFTKIDTLIRLKVLFSFLGLRKKQFQDLEMTINMLLQIADEEEDDWLKALAHLLSKVSEEKIPVNLDLEPFNSTLKKLSSQMDKDGLPNFFPLEYMYLNTKVLANPIPVVENIHFKMKRPITELPVFAKKPSSFTPTLSGSKSSVPIGGGVGSSSSQNLYSIGGGDYNGTNNNIGSSNNSIGNISGNSGNNNSNSPGLRNDKLKLSGSGYGVGLGGHHSQQQPSPLRKSNIFIPRTHHSSNSLDLSGGGSGSGVGGGLNSSNSNIGMMNSSLNMSGQHHHHHQQQHQMQQQQQQQQHPLNMSGSLNMSGHHHLASSGSGVSSEKRGIQKKTKMMTLNLDQVREITSTQTTKKRRQSVNEQSPTHQPEESPQLPSNLNLPSISSSVSGILDQHLQQQQQQQHHQHHQQPQQQQQQHLYQQQSHVMHHPSTQQINQPIQQLQQQQQHLHLHQQQQQQLQQQHQPLPPQQIQKQHQLYNIEESIHESNNNNNNNNNGHENINIMDVHDPSKGKKKQTKSIETSPMLLDKKEQKRREKEEKKVAKEREKEEKEREKKEKKEQKQREKEEKKEKKEKEKAEKRKNKDDGSGESAATSVKKQKTGGGTPGRKKKNAGDAETTPTIRDSSSPISSPNVTANHMNVNSIADTVSASLLQHQQQLQLQQQQQQQQQQSIGEPDLSGLSTLMNALEQNGSIPLEPQYMLQRSNNNVIPDVPITVANNNSIQFQQQQQQQQQPLQSLLYQQQLQTPLQQQQQQPFISYNQIGVLPNLQQHPQLQQPPLQNINMQQQQQTFSNFDIQQTLPQQQQQPSLESLLETATHLTPENRQIIERFVTVDKRNPTPHEGNLKQIPLSIEQKTNEKDEMFVETVIFEIDYEAVSVHCDLLLCIPSKCKHHY